MTGGPLHSAPLCSSQRQRFREIFCGRAEKENLTVVITCLFTSVAQQAVPAHHQVEEGVRATFIRSSPGPSSPALDVVSMSPPNLQFSMGTPPLPHRRRTSSGSSRNSGHCGTSPPPHLASWTVPPKSSPLRHSRNSGRFSASHPATFQQTTSTLYVYNWLDMLLYLSLSGQRV